MMLLTLISKIKKEEKPTKKLNLKIKKKEIKFKNKKILFNIIGF